MSVIVPELDLAPSVTSRVVTIDVIDMQEGAPAGDSVDFILAADLHVPADDKIIQAGSVTVTLDAAGHGEVRLPTYDPDVRPDGWGILVKKSWAPHPYLIRVPEGTTKISLADIEPVQEADPSLVSWLLTGASVSVVEGPQWGATVSTSGGVAKFVFTVPPGATPYWLGGTPLSSGSDLATLAAGVYSVNTNATAAALGLPGDVDGILTVHPYGAPGIQQWVPRLASSGVYQRIRTGAGWQPWTKVNATPTEVDAKIGGATLGAGVDLHTLSAGNYVALNWPTDWSAQHYPTQTRGIVEVRFVGPYRVLTMVGFDTGGLYTQVITAAGAGPWREYATTTGGYGSRPGYVTVPQNRSWDPTVRLYNAESPVSREIRRRLREGLNGVRDVHVVACGDSKVFGAGVGDPNPPVETGSTSPVIDAWPAQLAELVGARTGVIYAVAPGDPRWSHAGITAVSDTAKRFASGTGSITLVGDTPHTGAVIYVRAVSAASVDVTVDAGAAQPHAIPAGDAWQLITVSGLADTSHTIRIESTSEISVLGIRLTYDAPGLNVTNAARTSSTAAGWASTGWDGLWQTSIDLPGALPDVIVMGIGTNDRSNLAAIADLYDDLAATGVPVVVLAPGGLADDAPTRAMLNALYTAAQTHDLPLLDATQVLGTFTTAGQNGLMADSVHENARGHQLEAFAFARALAPTR